MSCQEACGVCVLLVGQVASVGETCEVQKPLVFLRQHLL